MVVVTEPNTIQKAVQIAGTLTDEALRNGSIKKNPEKRGNRGEPSKDRNVRDDNKRTRTGNAFATTTNPVGRENTGHFAKDCRVVPRNVNPINARNPAVRACYECGSTNHVKSACPRSGRFDVIIGMDWLSGHKAEIIFLEKVVRIPLLDGKEEIVKIKRLLDDLRVTAAQVRVTAAKHKLVVLVILMKYKLSINAAGKKVTTASVQS
ncbi:putative reverse transcriptase domain-containing protein [Tanacetum coccineum]